MSVSVEKGDFEKMETESKERSGLSFRAIIFGVLIGLFGVWAGGIRGEAYKEITMYQNIMLTSEEPVNLAFIAALVTLFLMGLIVPRIFPRLKIGFTRAELAVTFAAGLGTHAMGVGYYNVINKIAGFGHYSMTNAAVFGAFDATYPFVMPKDMDVIFDLLLGWADVPWGSWVVPMAFWFLVLLLMAFVPMCMGVIMRKRWAEHEQLTFPLARAVSHILDVEDDRTGKLKGFWKSKLLWIGAAITFSLVFYEWLQLELFPGLPVIDRYFLGNALAKLGASNPTLSWAMSLPDVTRIGFRSWGVAGVLYLAPSHDFLFTWVVLTPVMWFVNYILRSTVLAHATETAYWIGRSGVFFSIIAYSVMMAWRAKAEIKESIRLAFSKEIRNRDLEDQGLTIREAVYGLIIGTILLFIIFKFLLQIRVMWTLMLMLFFYVFAFALARFRAEVAFPSAGFLDIRPSRIFMQTFSHQLRLYPNLQMTNQDMAGISFINNHLRKMGPTLSMVNMVEGCWLADQMNLKRRSYFQAYFLGFILAAVPCVYMYLKAYYDVGTGLPDTWVRGGFTEFAGNIRNGQFVGVSPLPWRVPFGITFAGFVLLFAYLRANYVWWPFHPVGLIMVTVPNIPAHITAAGLVVLIAKAAILRYGGGSMYVKATPFFIGLVLGELIGFIARWIGMAILIYG